MLSTDTLNMGSFTSDPAHLLVEATQPVNLDTVIIDGRVLKRGGRMMAVDEERLIRDAEDSIKGVLARTAR